MRVILLWISFFFLSCHTLLFGKEFSVTTEHKKQSHSVVADFASSDTMVHAQAAIKYHIFWNPIRLLDKEVSGQDILLNLSSTNQFLSLLSLLGGYIAFTQDVSLSVFLELGTYNFASNNFWLSGGGATLSWKFQS